MEITIWKKKADKKYFTRIFNTYRADKNKKVVGFISSKNKFWHAVKVAVTVIWNYKKF